VLIDAFHPSTYTKTAVFLVELHTVNITCSCHYARKRILRGPTKSVAMVEVRT